MQILFRCYHAVHSLYLLFRARDCSARHLALDLAQAPSHHDRRRTQHLGIGVPGFAHHQLRAVPFLASADNTPAILNATVYSADSLP